MYKRGGVGPVMNRDGKEIPLEHDEGYQSLKKRTRADYRLIKPVRRSRQVPKSMADGIKALWEAML